MKGSLPRGSPLTRTAAPTTISIRQQVYNQCRSFQGNTHTWDQRAIFTSNRRAVSATQLKRAVQLKVDYKLGGFHSSKRGQRQDDLRGALSPFHQRTFGWKLYSDVFKSRRIR